MTATLSMPSAVKLARRALPLMNTVQRAEAHRLIGQNPAATAWEADMQPARTAIAAAMHSDGNGGLLGLQSMLPGLLREVNQGGEFTEYLGEAITTAVLMGFERENSGEKAPLTANAAGVTLGQEPLITDAMLQWRGRDVLPVDVGSAELRQLSREIKMRSIMSAYTTNAEYLEEIASVVDDILSGKINMATGRLRLMRKLKELGYDPATGFPGEYGALGAAEKGSLQDLSSEQRINLVLETNLRMAANYGKMLAGNQPYELREYPAWTLVRLYRRDVPRGTRRDHTGGIVDDPAHGWPRRWSIAGTAVNWQGATQDPMVARKDSPIWRALGDGTGSTFSDTLGNPFPPFAFNSGMGWQAAPRQECEALGLVAGAEAPAPMQGSLAPSTNSVVQAYDRLSPDLQAELKRELEALGL